MRETRAVVSAAGDCRALGARHALLNRIQLHESRTKTMNQFHYIRFSLPVISRSSLHFQLMQLTLVCSICKVRCAPSRFLQTVKHWYAALLITELAYGMYPQEI